MIPTIAVFFSSAAVLYILSKIGGPLKANVRGKIKKFGGTLWITGAGLVGAFIAISIIGLLGVYFLQK